MAAKLKSFSQSNPKKTGQEEGELDDLMQMPPSAGMLDGCVWLNAITDNAARDTAATLLRMAYVDPNRPVMMFLDSPGGEVDAMNAILSVMDSIPNKIVTVCMGKAFSAAAVILSHGDIRFVAPHGRVMIHEISGGAVGNIVDVSADAQEMDRLNKVYLELLAKNCKVKGGTKALRKLFSTRRDVYFDAEQAVNFGIADYIGVPRLLKMNQWLLDSSELDKNPKK